MLSLAGLALAACIFAQWLQARFHRSALAFSWRERDLKISERVADEKLYAVDPAFAIELGYIPLDRKQRAQHQHLLEPGLAKALADRETVQRFTSERSRCTCGAPSIADPTFHHSSCAIWSSTKLDKRA